MFKIFFTPFRLLLAAFGTFGPLFAFAFGILPFAAYLWLVTIAAKYDVSVVLHHTIPTFWAFLLGLVLGPITVTAAVVLKVLTLAGAIPALLAL